MPIKPVEKFPDLLQIFTALGDQIGAHFILAERLMKDEQRPSTTDLVVLSVLRRSLDLVAGIFILTEQWNFAPAGALLRMQIDNLLKLNYLFVVSDSDSDREAISLKILSGTSLRRVKDSQGKRLDDAQLMYYAKSKFPTLERSYAGLSKLVHLSEQHFGHTIESIDEPTFTVQSAFAIGMQRWDEPDISSFLSAVIMTTGDVFELADGWIASKAGRAKQNRDGQQP